MKRLATVIAVLLLVTSAVQAANIVINGDFAAGTAPWSLFSNGTHQYLVIEGEARVRVTAEGSAVTFYQRNLILAARTHYLVRFDARNTAGNDLRLDLVMESSPSTNYGLDEVFDLTAEMTTFTTQFVTSTPFTVTDARLRFRLDEFDTDGARYYFDNVVIESDRDADGVADGNDNCPDTANPDQADGDGDAMGTACDCNDADPAVHRGALEACNGIDDDCDGCADEGMTSCLSTSVLPAMFSFGDGHFSDTRSLAVDPTSGRIIVTDSHLNQVVVFDSTGSHLFTFGGPGTAPGLFDFVWGVAVDSQGRIVVVDTDNSRIQVFDSGGNYLFHFGSLGPFDGQFNYPTGVAIGNSDRIYVTDNDNDRIQVFDSDGNHLVSSGQFGNGPGEFHSPISLAIDPQGRVHVTELGGARVQVLDAEARPLFSYGSFGSAAGEFVDPSGIKIDSTGRAWVVDSWLNRFQVFDSSGNFLFVLHGSSLDPDLSEFYGIHIEGDVAYAHASGGDVIHTFQLVTDTDFDGSPLNYSCAVFGAGGDCDDTNADVYPGAPEICDGYANDCLAPDWPAMPPGEIDSDLDGVRVCDSDCDDTNAAIYPGAPEICDLWNNDCDALDWPAVSPDQADMDDDGVPACASDCNDLDASVFPGAQELCDARDNDCDACTDEGVTGCATGGSIIPELILGAAEGLSKPNDVTVDPDLGRILVADTLNDRILVLDGLGTPLFDIGESGNGSGQLNWPAGVAINSLGQVIVADRFNSRLQVFDATGNFLFQIGSAAVFEQPFAVAIDAEDRIYAVDVIAHNVRVFDAAGNLLNTIGAVGNSDGLFRNPAAIDVDSLNRIWVTEVTGHRLQAFESDGTHLLTIGGPDGLFLFPQGVAVDADQRIWVADSGHDAFRVFDDSGRHLVDYHLDIIPTGSHVFDGRIYTADYTMGTLRSYIIEVDGDGDGVVLPLACPGSSGDCNDQDAFTFPGAPEVCDGLNNDCDAPDWPATPSDEVDADLDGAPLCSDCDDNNPQVFPGNIETCNGIDDNCDQLADEDELGLDTDEDGVFNACDNCRQAFNPAQFDVDNDDVGNSCDNCANQFNPDQDDTDRDAIGDDCDNCPDAMNRSQSDRDGDDVGDICDLDDDLIYILPLDSNFVNWQAEVGFDSWNLYRGDLALLLAGGDYTQAVGATPLSDQFCGLSMALSPQPGGPPPGGIEFYLVAGVAAGVESGLGSSTSGARPNANPCP